MILKNLVTPDNRDKVWIKIEGNKISDLGIENSLGKQIENNVIEFENAIVFPGLINSHDHLEFNLFPKLGNKKYRDYVEWGEDIHKVNKNIIEEIKQIPENIRIEYGIYKNLLNGATTVVHHAAKENIGHQLIDVLTNYNYLHSTKLEKHWRLKLNLKVNQLPFVIHIGEGTNEESGAEIDNLIRWNLFKKDLIGIHGIKMNEAQAANFKALIWCPVSNDFLYGEQPAIEKIKRKTTILFGTDSNVSANWNLWHHLRFAKNLGKLSEKNLFETLTSMAAKMWKLKDKGSITKGFRADLVIARRKYKDDFLHSFYEINPEDILIITKNGKVILFDSLMKNQFAGTIKDFTEYSEIEINKNKKFVKGRIDELCKKIKSYSSSVSFPFEY